MTESRRVPVEPTEEMLERALRLIMSRVICYGSLRDLWAELLAAAPPDELAELEREIADFYARKTIEAAQAWNESGWLDTGSGVYGGLIRYLELRGLLERHPENPTLVRLMKE